MKEIKFWQPKGGQRTTATMLWTAMAYQAVNLSKQVAVIDADAVPMAGLTAGVLDTGEAHNGLLFVTSTDGLADDAVVFGTEHLNHPYAEAGDYNVLVSATEYMSLHNAVHYAQTFPMDAFVTYWRQGLALSHHDAYRALCSYAHRSVHVQLDDDIVIARSIDAGLFMADTERTRVYRNTMSELVSDIDLKIGVKV